MGIALMGLGGILTLVGAVCGIIVLIGAFQSEIWKGLVSLFCPFYILYFAFAEWQHEKKGTILAGWLLGALIGNGLMMAGMAMSGAAVPTPG